MTARRIPLNLYLLKEGTSPAVATPRAASALSGHQERNGEASALGEGWIRCWTLDEEPRETVLPAEIPQAPVLLVRAVPAEDTWYEMLGGLVSTIPLAAERVNYGALLFQRVADEVVVWSFGNAWPLLDAGCAVERFGLKAGLNALLASKPTLGTRTKRVGVRGLTSAIRAAVTRRSTVLTARPSKPAAMERVDQSSDAAAVAELTTHHAVFDRVAAGRSLRFEAPVASLSDLAGYATEALRLYRRDDYSRDDSYKWIDYTVPVGDEDEVDLVLDELLVQAMAPTPITIDLVWADADPDTGITPSYVCFPNERSSGTAARRTELTWTSAFAWLRRRAAGRPGREALRTRLRFLDDGIGRTIEVDLWELLVAQISVDSDTYIVSDGEVWRASASYIADIDSLLSERVTVNPPWLPSYKGGESEDSYNRRAAGQGRHLLLDKNLVRIPGQTAFEPCDLLSADGRLMHVKRKTSSSTMSHVVSQALTSTQLLRSEATVRRAVGTALADHTPIPPHLSAMRGHVDSFAARPTATVDVVVIGTWRAKPAITQLPILTRISLYGWVRQMPCEAGLILVGT